MDLQYQDSGHWTLETLGTPRTIWKELEFLQIWSLENYSFGSSILTLVITQGKAECDEHGSQTGKSQSESCGF